MDEKKHEPVGRRAYDDTHWVGYITAKVEQHDDELKSFKSDCHLKRSKLQDLIIEDQKHIGRIGRLEDMLDEHIRADEAWRKDFMKVFDKLSSQVIQIKWIVVGIGIAFTFVVYMSEKLPIIVDALRQLLG